MLMISFSLSTDATTSRSRKRRLFRLTLGWWDYWYCSVGFDKFYLVSIEFDFRKNLVSTGNHRTDRFEPKQKKSTPFSDCWQMKVDERKFFENCSNSSRTVRGISIDKRVIETTLHVVDWSNETSLEGVLGRKFVFLRKQLVELRTNEKHDR